MLHPLHALIDAHVLAAERLHRDDTTVPILTKGKTVKGHIWTYVRDDRPFGSRALPAALYYASRDRRHEHLVRHLKAFRRHPAGQCLWRIQRALRAIPLAGADHVGAVLGSCQEV